MPYSHEVTRTPAPPTPVQLVAVDVVPDAHYPIRMKTRAFTRLSPAEARDLASALVSAANDVPEHPDNAPVPDEPAPREHDDEPVNREFPGFGERPQDVDETHDDRLDRVIHEALGAASVAWTGTPRGTFDAAYARSIGAALLAEVRRYARIAVSRGYRLPPHEFPEVPTLPGAYRDRSGDHIRIHDDGTITGWLTGGDDGPSSYNILKIDDRRLLNAFTPYTRTE